VSANGDPADQPGGPGVQLRQGELIALRPSVELFPAAGGDLYLIEPGRQPDLVVRHPAPADRLLLAALARAPATVEALERALPLDRGTLLEKLGDLRRAGVLASWPPPERPLPAEDAERFARQLPYFAERGEPEAIQRRLLEATVAVLGCGGLGTWALGALACAGVRGFTLIDDDAVELSNLNRQVLYAPEDIGTSKAERAAAWVRRFEPRARVRVVPRRVRGPEDLEAALAGADALVHAADWPPYDILRWADAACRASGIPYIVAGQVPPVLKIGPTYVPGRSACFACQEASTRAAFPLYDELAAFRRAHPAPATTLGPASGVVGTLLALEVMHLLSGEAPVATEGRALLLDMRTLHTRWETIERRADCRACQHLGEDGGTRSPGADPRRQGAVASAAPPAPDRLRGP
jgi:molybdopterin-synthase adenylyltransferase